MPERIQNNAEEEARKEVVEIYKTLEIPTLDNSSATDLWRDLLRKTRGRFEKFRYKPLGYEQVIFIPQVQEEDHDEQIIFLSQVPIAGYQPTIEWGVLQKKTPETKELFTAILSLNQGKPKISLMQETFSIFMVRGLKIDNLMSAWVPKMESVTVTIGSSTDAGFSRDELGKKVEGGYISTEEALQKIQIPA